MILSEITGFSKRLIFDAETTYPGEIMTVPKKIEPDYCRVKLPPVFPNNNFSFIYDRNSALKLLFKNSGGNLLLW